MSVNRAGRRLLSAAGASAAEPAAAAALGSCAPRLLQLLSRQHGSSSRGFSAHGTSGPQEPPGGHDRTAEAPPRHRVGDLPRSRSVQQEQLAVGSDRDSVQAAGGQAAWPRRSPDAPPDPATRRGGRETMGSEREAEEAARLTLRHGSGKSAEAIMAGPEAAEAPHSNTAVKFVYQQQPSPYSHDTDAAGTTSTGGAEQVARQYMETAGSSNETSRAGGPTDDIPELGGVSGMFAPRGEMGSDYGLRTPRQPFSHGAPPEAGGGVRSGSEILGMSGGSGGTGGGGGGGTGSGGTGGEGSDRSGRSDGAAAGGGGQGGSGGGGAGGGGGGGRGSVAGSWHVNLVGNGVGETVKAGVGRLQEAYKVMFGDGPARGVGSDRAPDRAGAGGLESRPGKPTDAGKSGGPREGWNSP